MGVIPAEWDDLVGIENGGPVTQKDVYVAVDNVRVELGGKIDKLAELVNQVGVIDEHRITVAEENLASQGTRLTAAEVEIKKHSDEVSDINTRLREDEAATDAISKIKTASSTTKRWVIGTIVAIVGVLLTVGYLLLALHI